MARGYIATLLNSLPSNIKTQLQDAFDYVTDNWRLGPIEHGKRATNAQLYWFTSTTASTAGDEFSIAHGLGSTPQHLILGVALDAVNAQIVPVQVSRAADASRVYLKSTSTSAVIFVGVGL